MSENRFTPCIVLPGIGQSKVELLDKKGEKIKMAWPLDVNGDELMGKLKGPLMKMMLFRKDGGFSARYGKNADFRMGNLFLARMHISVIMLQVTILHGSARKHGKMAACRCF